MRRLFFFRDHSTRSWIGIGLTFILLVVITWLIPIVPILIREWLIVLLLLVLVFLGFILYRLNIQFQSLRKRIEELEKIENESYTRIETTLRVSQQFALTSDEEQIVSLAGRLMLDLTKAIAVTFVALDARGHTLKPKVVGELPFGVTTDYLEFLASPVIRERCSRCQDLEKMKFECPLIIGQQSIDVGVYCIPLRKGDYEYGVFNLFLPRTALIHNSKQVLLRHITDETALALEGVRLHTGEDLIAGQLETLKARSDSKQVVTKLLQLIGKTFQADSVLILLGESISDLVVSEFQYGSFSESIEPDLPALLSRIDPFEGPVLLGNYPGKMYPLAGYASILVAPIFGLEKKLTGLVLVLAHKKDVFREENLPLFETISEQLALLLQNANTLAELEYKAVLQERIRLAREIHDGLAQTLGFLKLKLSQLKGYLEQGDKERLRQTVNLCFEAVSDAYLDARQSIDELRVPFHDAGIAEWLQQAGQEFIDMSGIPCEIYLPAGVPELSAEINAQLIRIVQEALNNIRKHSKAKRVQLSTEVKGNNLVIEIRDDGIGFYPEDIPKQSQYGLRGMRERAELIGSELEIVSRPQEGTIVRVRVAVSVRQGN